MTMDGARMVRPPAHAGTFYPASPEALRRLVDGQLAAAASARPAPPGPRVGDHGAAVTPPGPPVGLVVPHAGLHYSGRVAAAAWSLLSAAPPAVVVLAGTNHYVPGLRGVAVWPAGAWRIPVDDVRVDQDLAGRILALGEPFAADPDAHRREHSLEVQVPFVARACPGTPIVPLLVSFESTRSCLDAGTRLGRLLSAVRAEGKDAVLVASSDFAHYPPAPVAEAVTRALLPALLDLDGEELARREAGTRMGDLPGVACGMCGIEPVLFAIGAFRAMGLRRGRLLASATSADVPGGDPDRTVGYAAVAFEA